MGRDGMTGCGHRRRELSVNGKGRFDVSSVTRVRQGEEDGGVAC